MLFRTNSIQKAKALSNYSMALAMDKQFGVALSAARDVISEAANMNSDEAVTKAAHSLYPSFHFRKASTVAVITILAWLSSNSTTSAKIEMTLTPCVLII